MCFLCVLFSVEVCDKQNIWGYENFHFYSSGCEANYSIRNSSKDRRRLDVLMIRIRLNEVTSILSLKKTCTPGLPAPMPQDLHEPIWAFVIAECLHNKSFGSKGTIVISILRESLIYIINYIFENLIIDDTVVSQKKKIFQVAKLFGRLFIPLMR